MLGDILLLFRIRMTRKVNGFFYYFKKLPLIGRLLKESCYAAVNLKGVLSVFSFLVDVLMNLLKNLLYLFVVIAVPLINLQKCANDVQIRNGFLFGFVLLSLVAGSISNSKLLTADDETFILSRQMHMAARRCLCSHSCLFLNMVRSDSSWRACFCPLCFRFPSGMHLLRFVSGLPSVWTCCRCWRFQRKNSFVCQANADSSFHLAP